MGRRSHTTQLIIWMNGQPVGRWEKQPTGELFQYFDDWMHSKQGRPLSLSLPFIPADQAYRGAGIKHYFDNLLPDSDAIRRRLAQRHRIEGIEPFELLAELGRDCVGAIQILRPDQTPDDLFTIKGQALGEADVARILRNTTVATPLGRHDDEDSDLRLSIAGAQEKTALLYHEGQWHRPEGSTPTTHIFKLPLGLVGGMQADMHASVENEWLCSRLVAAYGLPVASCEMGYFEDQKALIVERFDRRLSSDASWIVRLPQEDMCQATGTPPHLKYQSDGGPGIATIMELLLGSDRAQKDRRHFFKTQVVFWMLAATDGHAKNFSIVHQAGGYYHATPLYDVLSAHPIIGTGVNRIAPQKAKLAMAVRGSANYYLISKIQRRHWLSQAQQVGLAEREAEDVLEEVVDATDRVIELASNQLPHDFPAGVADSIFEGLRGQRDRLVAQAGT